VRRSCQQPFYNYFNPPLGSEREALLCAFAFGYFSDRKNGNPKGIESFSPGLRAARYPGWEMAKDLNPERVA
jgi:hypothetical protein